MRQVIAMCLVSIVVALPAFAQQGEEVSVKALPPVVVKTVPESGSTTVDPKLTEISVTFTLAE